MTENNKLLAEVNGKKIYTQDVYKLMANMEDGQRFNNEEGIKVLCDEIVNQEILLKDAVDKKLDEETDFVKELEAVKDNMLKNYAMHKIFEEIKLDDSEIKAYYEKIRRI